MASCTDVCYCPRMMTERSGVVALREAVRFVNENFPLPRCEHGRALRDHGGDRLEPSCGCELRPCKCAIPSRGVERRAGPCRVCKGWVEGSLPGDGCPA